VSQNQVTMSRRGRSIRTSNPPVGAPQPAFSQTEAMTGRPTTSDIMQMSALATGTFAAAHHQQNAQPTPPMPRAAVNDVPYRPSTTTHTVAATAPTSAAALANTNNFVRELTALKQQVQQLSGTVSQWQQILTEITQAVFVVNATATADNIPYYAELPESKDDLKSANVGNISKGTKVTLMYPQFRRPDLLFMRLRVVDAHTADVQQYYVPVANQGLSAKDLLQYTGLNAEQDQYFDNFHNPGSDVTDYEE
jgi:hypothetical protein